MGPGLVLIGFVDILAMLVAVGALRQRVDPMSVAFLLASLGIPLYALSYFLRSSLTADNSGLTFRNWMGMSRHVSSSEFGFIDDRGGYRGSGTYAFVDHSGRTLFKLNSRAWSSDDVVQIARRVRGPGHTDPTGRP